MKERNRVFARVCAFALAAILLVGSSMTVLAATSTLQDADTSVVTIDKTAAISVTEAYLEECAFSLYFYEPRAVEEYTIKSIALNERTSLTQKASEYSSFRAVQEVVPFEETALNTGDLSAFEDNLSLHEDKIAYYGHLHEIEAITYSFFTPSYEVADCTIAGDIATVNIYECLDFQYSDCDEPSMVRTHYYVSLIKANGEWLIAAIESDDQFYQAYRESGFNLQREIAGVDEARAENIISTSVSTNISEENSTRAVAALANTDRAYIPQNAANYALTYSTSSDTGATPSYKNTKFYWTSASCQLFVSQCVWAGLGGSNAQTDINNKQGMDKSGSYQWWSTETLYNHPDHNASGSLPDKGWNSWIYCPQFKVYVDAVKGSSTETGVVCDTKAVAYNSNDLVGTSGITSSDLLGAALHVKGSSNGLEVALGHAIIINEATGTTRQTVKYTAYNNTAKNVQLSLSYPSSTTNTKNNIYVMVPRYMRGESTAATNYLYGDLMNAMQKGTSGVTKTVYGRAKSAVTTLTVKVYAPNATTASYTFTASNKNVASGSVLFNTVGEWRVVVSGTGLSSYTYTVRIVT